MSIANSIKSSLVPVHPEGYRFIGMFFVAAIVLGWFWSPLFYLGLLLTGWCAYFFRDPERITPISDDLVISPADGTVSHIGPVVPPAELGLGDKPMLRISVFMNVFNCHVNRAPVRGRISGIFYKPGKYLSADLDKASSENERNSMIIDSPHGPLAVVQIAGLVARRIVCWAEENHEIGMGDRFGLIRFGSRLDVYLPEGAGVRVVLGQTMIAGETILAAWYDTAKSSPISKVS